MCNKLNRVPKKCLHFYSLWRLKGFFKQFLLTSSLLIKNNLKFKLLQNLCQKSMRKIVVGGGGRRENLQLFNSLKISPRCQKNYETYSSSRRREAKPEVIQQSEDVTSVLKKYEKDSSRRREEAKPEVIQSLRISPRCQKSMGKILVGEGSRQNLKLFKV